jgi:hypothetical protein
MQSDEAQRMILIDSIAQMFEDLLPSAGPGDHPVCLPFRSAVLPSISLQNYLLRISKGAKTTPACFVLSLVYLDRLWLLQPQCLAACCIHR